jgi:hypothetical protein
MSREQDLATYYIILCNPLFYIKKWILNGNFDASNILLTYQGQHRVEPCLIIVLLSEHRKRITVLASEHRKGHQRRGITLPVRGYNYLL